MGMTWSDWEDLTPGAFFYKYRGWLSQQEDLQKYEWERARFIAVIAGNAGRYKKGLTESQFRFPWEKEVNLKPLGMSPKEFMAYAEKTHGKYLNGNR